MSRDLKRGWRIGRKKTVNNVLVVLNTLMRKAKELKVIAAMPWEKIGLLPPSEAEALFHDFDAYGRLIAAAQRDPVAHLVVLLGGDAGLRCGEIIALEWTDLDLAARRACVSRSEWKGRTTTPKGGRLRYVPLTQRLAAALKEHRHALGRRVLCQADGAPLTAKAVQKKIEAAAKRAGVVTPRPVHILRHTFCSHLAMRGATAMSIEELAGHRSIETTQRYMHLSPSATEAAIRLLENGAIAATLAASA